MAEPREDTSPAPEADRSDEPVATDSAGVYLGFSVADFEARSSSARAPLAEDLPAEER